MEPLSIVPVEGPQPAVIRLSEAPTVIRLPQSAPVVIKADHSAGLMRLRDQMRIIAPAPVSVTQAQLEEAMRGPTTEPTGFPNRDDSTFAFDELTRTFTVSPVSDSFDVYIAGVKLTITEPQSVVVPDATGESFFYFDADTGLLTRSGSFEIDIIGRHAYTAVLYWNAAQQKAVYFGEERHGVTMDGATHSHFHQSMGTQWINGLALTGIQADQTGDLDAHAQFGTQGGLIRDEDIPHTLAALAAPANMPVFYRIGTDWYSSSVDGFPLIYAGKDGWAGTLPAAALDTAGAWSLSEVGNNNFLLIHVLATNDVRYPVVAILGQEYSTKSQARSAAQEEFSQLTGLPFQELTPMGTVIYQCQNGDGNTPKAHIVSTEDGGDYIDWRASQSFAGAAMVSGDQEVFIGETPAVSYPAIAFAPVDGEPALYDFMVNA